MYGEHTAWSFLAILFIAQTVGGVISRGIGVTDPLNAVQIGISVMIFWLISRLVLVLRHRRR